MSDHPDDLLAAARTIATHFALAAPIRDVKPFGEGLINRTYLVMTSGPSYVLQRINGHVFPNPNDILANLHQLNLHHRRQPATALQLPALVATGSGELGYQDRTGALWRMLEHIPGTRTLTRLDHPEQAAAVGRALGRFHRLCADLSPAALARILPDFHVTPHYLEHLFLVLAERPELAQAPELRWASAFVRDRQRLAGLLEAGRAEGRLPERVCHGDPKLENVLFDEAGRQAVSLIDLDTVQPGLLHHDIGDCLRSCCNRRGEAGQGPSFDLDLCRGLLAGYAHATEGLLAAHELTLLYEAVRLIPYELGIRFLTDHLEGDRYFRVRRPGENLTKALTQFHLVADIEDKQTEIKRLIAASFVTGAA